MTIPRFRLVIALLVGLGAMVPGAGRADSDGYYCATEKYIAYEFRFSKYPHPEHFLTVIFFNDVWNKIKPVRAPLANFQTQGMKCDDDSVALLSSTEIHTVDLSRRTNPRVVDIQKLNGDMDTGLNRDDYRPTGSFTYDNFNPAKYPDTPTLTIVPLSPTNRKFEYDLHVVTYVEVYPGPDPNFGGVHITHIDSKIVKRQGPNIVDIFNIHAGSSELTVD